jgi:WD40 repeat protein
VFSPTGRVIASGSWDGDIRLWDIENSTCRNTLRCGKFITDLVFSPQGHQLASSSRDNRIQLWDLETGNCLMILISYHQEWYDTFITYSQDGDTLISGCNNEIRLWDVVSGQCRSVIRDIYGEVQGFTRGSSLGEVYVVTRLDTDEKNLWRIIDEADRCHLGSLWINASGQLEVTGATIQDVRGMSQLNKQLLKQRGAQGDPELLFPETSKKVVAVASALSKLGQSVERTNEQDQTPPMTELPKEQAGLDVEQSDNA